MRTTYGSRFLSGVLLAIVLIGLVAALQGQQAKPEVKYVPPAPTSAADGAEMYREYCAVCHGLDGKGMGPAMPALKKMPADLTELTAKNKGKFPELRVYGVLSGEVDLTAHGSRDMPVWGKVFREMSRRDNAIVQLRLRNLTKYVETLQK
jgi:mono/diheme cytochrome c family protein